MELNWKMIDRIFAPKTKVTKALFLSTRCLVASQLCSTSGDIEADQNYALDRASEACIKHVLAEQSNFP